MTILSHLPRGHRSPVSRMPKWTHGYKAHNNLPSSKCWPTRGTSSRSMMTPRKFMAYLSHSVSSIQDTTHHPELPMMISRDPRRISQSKATCHSMRSKLLSICISSTSLSFRVNFIDQICLLMKKCKSECKNQTVIKLKCGLRLFTII